MLRLAPPEEGWEGGGEDAFVRDVVSEIAAALDMAEKLLRPPATSHIAAALDMAEKDVHVKLLRPPRNKPRGGVRQLVVSLLEGVEHGSERDDGPQDLAVHFCRMVNHNGEGGEKGELHGFPELERAVGAEVLDLSPAAGGGSSAESRGTDGTGGGGGEGGGVERGLDEKAEMHRLKTQTLDAILQNRLFSETDMLLLLVQTLDERGGGSDMARDALLEMIEQDLSLSRAAYLRFKKHLVPLALVSRHLKTLAASGAKKRGKPSARRALKGALGAILETLAGAEEMRGCVRKWSQPRKR
ncbi:hypothetical protein T484DRAFT_1795424 [Baffinella frigidus]|nr:hypothetical protein T484DRAFT_1795424 [Cryptophyta sp. CCMP2293]